MFGAKISRIVKAYDYINRVVLTLPLSVYEGTWTHSPLSLLCITMILSVRRIFFEITTFTNTLDPQRKEIKLFTRESSQQAKEERKFFLGFLLITTTTGMESKLTKSYN